MLSGMEWDGSSRLGRGVSGGRKRKAAVWDPQEGVSALHLLPSGRRRSRTGTWAGQCLVTLLCGVGIRAASSGEGGAEAVEASALGAGSSGGGRRAAVPWGECDPGAPPLSGGGSCRAKPSGQAEVGFLPPALVPSEQTSEPRRVLGEAARDLLFCLPVSSPSPPLCAAPLVNLFLPRCVCFCQAEPPRNRLCCRNSRAERRLPPPPLPPPPHLHWRPRPTSARRTPPGCGPGPPPGLVEGALSWCQAALQPLADETGTPEALEVTCPENGF